MDRNQIIGLVLIGLILFGYMIYTQPSKEEIEAQNRKRDSIINVQKMAEQKAMEEEQKRKNEMKTDSLRLTDSTLTDSAKVANLKAMYGDFSAQASGEQKFITLENKYMRVKISNLGGRIYSTELKEYTRFDSLPLLLFDGDKNVFGLDFFAGNKTISTKDFYFEPQTKDSVVKADKTKQTVKLRLNAGENKYLEYIYSLEPESYLLSYTINFVNLNNVISSNSKYIDLNWSAYLPGLERGVKWENQNSAIYYKYHQDEVNHLSPTGDEEKEKLSTRVKWIGYKHQFFSNVLIANNAFENASIEQINYEGKDGVIKHMSSRITLPYEGKAQESIPMTFYFGPNQYKVLKNTSIAENDDLQLQKMLPLGWTIFGWVNRFAIIPLFNWLGSFLTNYGLIILIMTIIIKLVLFPLTYKSFLSTAKMRVLKPEIDEINKRIPAEKAMERQQAVMAMYRKAGVNPLGGCIPVLLQMPILIAMFNFFPASIELRHKAFLWATDLSTYDSILDLPFEIPLYGAHVSLFTLLMTAAIVVSTIMNGNQMDTSNQQLPGMKFMMYYLMPLMMLVWFNSYSAGLSYYYFLSNVITIIQTYLIRRFVDEDAIHRKLKENQKKNKNQEKSKFQQKLEDMAKQRGYKMPK